jgi:DNA replication protein DnaC
MCFEVSERLRNAGQSRSSHGRRRDGKLLKELTGRSGKGRRLAQKFAPFIQTVRYRAAEAEAAKADLIDDAFVRNAVLGILECLAPDYKVPESFVFRVLSEAGSLRVETNLDLAATNQSFQRLFPFEEIDYRASRGLDKSVIRALTQKSAWAEQHENIFVLGPTGVGKSFVACALAQKACRDGYSALYIRAVALFRDLSIARADGSLRSLLVRLSRIDVLVIDDWAMAPLAEAERRDFWEICEDRYQTRSTILTSQLPVARWHEQIGDPTAADGILDRLVHNAHRIEMRGDSMRKSRAKPNA